MSAFDPPLLGDKQGNYRIYIIGNSGTGKTTLGAYLSTKLNAPHVSLDQVAWKPGWKKMQSAEFREDIRDWMARHDRGWIIDGNYYQDLGTLVRDEATDIIWLDPPLCYYLPRLVWRTLMRIFRLKSPCARGCEETWTEIFSSKGIIWYCITKHSTIRERYRVWLSRMHVEVGGKMRRLDESRGELTRWKNSLAK